MALTRAQRVGGALAIASVIAAGMEGLRQSVYADPVGIATVCFGHTGFVDKGKRYTLDECKALLDADMRQAVELVEACWPNRLPTKSLAAFGDLAFNAGPKVICDVGYSQLAKHLAMGDLRAACEDLPRYDKARVGGVLVTLPGLTKRRALERKLCLEGVEDERNPG